MTTMIRRLEEWRRKPGFLAAEAMLHSLCRRVEAFASGTRAMADFDASMSQIDVSSPDRMSIKVLWIEAKGPR